MKDERITKLARMIVNYSLSIKNGEKVMVNFIGQATEPLASDLIEEILKAGGVPFWFYDNAPLNRKFAAGASEAQVKTFGAVHKSVMEQMQCYIGVRGSDNQFETADVPPDKMKTYRLHYMQPVHMETRVPKTRWVVMRWPTASMAQQARMSTEAFEKFYFDVCTLDYAKMSRAMDHLVAYMQKTDRVRLVGPGVDIAFSIKGIPAIKCDGKLNIPDGEVFTAPVKDSINGFITFNTPSMQEGLMYEGIKLEYKNGRLENATARNDVDRLRKVFDADDGCKYVGEFAIGVNPFVLTPMNDTLFDEKIAGSIHFTPGNAYDEAFNGNRSSLHWDLVLIQRPEYGGGEMYFDGQLIRKDGLFVVKELECLNPEHLK
ncbi:MAG: aminopeptidase [Candidatus Brocadiia bacterium]